MQLKAESVRGEVPEESGKGSLGRVWSSGLRILKPGCR